MDLEKLAEGQRISKLIIQAQERLAIWEGSTGFTDNKIVIDFNSEYRMGQKQMWGSCDPSFFSMMKMYHISYWQTKLAELEKQFADL